MFNAPRPTPTVTVWSDIGCPWATLALATLRTAIEQRNAAVDIDHRAFPLELFNAGPTPQDIVDPEIVAIASLLPELGWSCWSAPASSYPVTTLPAMAAVQAAKHPDVGGLRASDQLDAALRQAFYIDHRCISIHSVILDTARTCPDLDPVQLERQLAQGAGIAAIHHDFEQARSLPIQGSPVVETADGARHHNPGATYHWTSPPPTGFARLEHYDPQWAEDLLDQLTPGRRSEADAGAPPAGVPSRW
ncbi:DsbA family oxidoreductase [Arthrobacter sp. 179]|uniref:DsbA family oxidoreductase n=1 Tax=Arthrobacter sp. 179 TaxID=3457734 RepID=UPI004033B5CC